MFERFGLTTAGSVEVFFDPAIGWCVRGYSGPARSGYAGESVVTAAGDVSVTVAALNTVPTLLASDSLVTVGDWHVDEETHSVWINVGSDRENTADPSFESVDGLMDAESRWERLGIGKQTPRG